MLYILLLDWAPKQRYTVRYVFVNLGVSFSSAAVASMVLESEMIDSKGLRAGFLTCPHKANQETPQGASVSVTFQNQGTIVSCTGVCWCELKI